MSRSTRFNSLGGLSGVIIGFIGLAGAIYTDQLLLTDSSIFSYERATLPNGIAQNVLGTSTIVLVTSLIVGVLFTLKEARKNKEKVWNAQSKRVLTSLFIPLVAGGIVCLILLRESYIGMLPAMTMIFYGLALINTSKYTIDTIRALGLSILLAGLLAFTFVQYGLVLWAIAFGALHIVFGFYMHLKKQ